MFGTYSCSQSLCVYIEFFYQKISNQRSICKQITFMKYNGQQKKIIRFLNLGFSRKAPQQKCNKCGLQLPLNQFQKNQVFVWEFNSLLIKIIISFQRMVFFFVPNIIGYVRYFLVFSVLLLFRSHPFVTAFLYSFSQVLDHFDGYAARKLNQCSKFGAVLDMVCDRVSDAVILCILAEFYPSYSWCFMLAIILDISSHWFQMYSAACEGEHHKESKTKWKVLEQYYSNKVVFEGLIAGNEIFFVTCYLSKFLQNSNTGEFWITTNNFILGISFILFMWKNIVNVFQLVSASQKIAQSDMEARKKLQLK